MVYMSRKRKRGRIIIPVVIVLMFSLVAIYRLNLDADYQISLNVVNKEGDESQISNKDLRKYLDTKRDEVKNAAGGYLDKRRDN